MRKFEKVENEEFFDGCAPALRVIRAGTWLTVYRALPYGWSQLHEKKRKGQRKMINDRPEMIELARCCSVTLKAMHMIGYRAYVPDHMDVVKYQKRNSTHRFYEVPNFRNSLEKNIFPEK